MEGIIRVSGIYQPEQNFMFKLECKTRVAIKCQMSLSHRAAMVDVSFMHTPVNEGMDNAF